MMCGAGPIACGTTVSHTAHVAATPLTPATPVVLDQQDVGPHQQLNSSQQALEPQRAESLISLSDSRCCCQDPLGLHKRAETKSFCENKQPGALPLSFPHHLDLVCVLVKFIQQITGIKRICFFKRVCSGCLLIAV